MGAGLRLRESRTECTGEQAAQMSYAEVALHGQLKAAQSGLHHLAYARQGERKAGSTRAQVYTSPAFSSGFVLALEQQALQFPFERQ